MKIIMTLMIMLSVFACKSAPEKVEPTKDETTKEVSQVQEASPYDGTYVFDVERYKESQLGNEKSMFKKMEPKDMDRMLQVFRPFKIQVEGDYATASFAHDVIKGKLQKLEVSESGAHLYLTPEDEAKKDQAVTLIIDGNNLVLDPGKDDVDKMYFKKMI